MTVFSFRAVDEAVRTMSRSSSASLECVGPDRTDCHVESQPEVTIGRSIDVEITPFEQDREIGGFLKLEHQKVLADRVRRAGRDEHGVARTHRDRSEQIDHGIRILLVDESRPLVTSHSSVGADEDGAAGRLGLEDHPGLRLPVRAVEMFVRKPPSWMQMNRQPL